MHPTVRKRALAAIFACISIYGLTLGLLRPLLALILESRGFEKSVIGLVATMPAFGMLAISPLIPALIRLLGIRRFLQACLFADLCVLLCFPILDNIYAWMGLCVVTGAAANCLLVASETWINEIAIDATRGRVLAVYNALLLATMALGPLIIPAAGIEGFLPFIIAASFVALASIPLFWTNSGGFSMHGKASFNLLSFVYVAPVLSFAVLLFAWKEFAGASLLPVYGVSHGMAPSQAAVMLTAAGAGGLLMTLPFGWLADFVNRYLLLVACGGGILVCSLLLPLVMAEGWGLWTLLFIWGGFFAGLYTVMMTILGQRFRGVELAVANIAIGILWGVGSLTGPSLTGVAMDIWDPHGFVLMVVLASAAFVIFASARWYFAEDRSKVV